MADERAPVQLDVHVEALDQVRVGGGGTTMGECGVALGVAGDRHHGVDRQLA